MHPLLFEIPLFGGIKIYTYGVMYALAIVASFSWIFRESKKQGLSSSMVSDLGFYLILGSLIGSRVLYVMTDWHRYVDHPWDVFKVWQGGLVFYGGFLGSVAVGWFYIRKHRLNFLQIADVFAPAIALGHSVGRLGCFAAGCCYGREGHTSFSVVFPQNEFSLAPPGIPLFPSQPLESLVLLILFVVLAMLSRRKTFEGQIFLVYIILYSLIRSFLEIFRGDLARGFVVPDLISISQFISGCLILVAVFFYAKLSQKRTL